MPPPVWRETNERGVKDAIFTALKREIVSGSWQRFPYRLKGAGLAAVLTCRPVVRRCMNAREQTPAGGRQGR